MRGVLCSRGGTRIPGGVKRERATIKDEELRGLEFAEGISERLGMGGIASTKGLKKRCM